MKRKRTTLPQKKNKKQKIVGPQRSMPTHSIESKVYDIAAATYQINTTGTSANICTPILGSDFTNRVGRRITMTSVQIRGMIIPEYAGSGTVGITAPQMVRMVLAYDRQPNALLAGVNGFLTAPFPTAFLDLNNRDRFQVLVDRQWVLDPWMYSTTATQSYAFGGTSKEFKVFRKINLETVFNAVNGGTFADIVSGALVLFFVGSSVAGAQDANAIINTRVRFVDA